MIGVRPASGATAHRDTKSFPRRHLIVFVAVAMCLAFVLSLMPAGNVSANRKAITIELPLADAVTTSEEANTPAQVPWLEITVKSGDNLSLLFQRAGLTDADVYDLVRRAEGGKSLTRIYPGQILGFQVDESGQFKALRYTVSALRSTLFVRTEKGYSVEEVEREPQVHRSFATATIDSSLYLAGQKAGLSQNLIMEMANIFGGVIDFVLDPRKGDTFHILYEELYLDGEKFGDGKVLAAEFVNQGRIYEAFRYVNEDGYSGYFAEDGVSMRKAFLMAPLDFTRISSNFNPQRLHPIYKTKRPHRGTDYAAPRGTPVFAAGDGRVVEAGFSRANGNYVVLQHGEQYTTKYLHLSKRNVKQGERVKQQQIIGTVGSTGAATGPHLHYEFLVSGVHRNPRTIYKKLPKAKSLSREEMVRFQDQTQGLQMQLASIRQQNLAMNTSPSF